MSLAQAAESIPSGQGQSNREESTTSNFGIIPGLQMNNYLEQKFQHNMLLSSYTAVALALAKHRSNGEKTRVQRKQGNYCSDVVAFASGVVDEEPKLRRNRTAFNDNQLDKLESCFQSCQYPTVAIRDRLAKGKKDSIDPFKTTFKKPVFPSPKFKFGTRFADLSDIYRRLYCRTEEQSIVSI